MKSSDAKQRPDGRKQLLVYLDPVLIRALKRRALDEDTHLYLLIEEILAKDSAERDLEP